MVRNYDQELKEVFPPTPQVFAISMDAALRSLPRNERRWKMPRLSLAAYALAACAVFTGVFVCAVSPAIAPPKSTHPAVAPSPSPLPRANQSVMKAADGWQVVAVAGETQWFFNPGSGDIGLSGPVSSLAGAPEGTSSAAYVFASDGSIEACATGPELFNQAISSGQWRTTTFKLDISAGWAVDTYTFLPASDGRWVAFTLHGPSGDDVWVITQDGRKMSLQNDVRWVDWDDNPIQANFSGATLLPMIATDNVSILQVNSNSDVLPEGICITAQFPNGEAYQIEVSLSTAAGSKSLLLDDRRGAYYPLNFGDCQAAVGNHNYYVRVRQLADGKYTMVVGGSPMPVDILSYHFSLCRFPENNSSMRPNHALIVYAGDATRTLWELNIKTGEQKKIATGCVAADWTGEANYWYAAEPDATNPVLREAEGARDVAVDIRLVQSLTEDNGSVAVQMYVLIQNRTDSDVIIPEDIPCSLTLTHNGKTIWTQSGSFTLSDTTRQNLSMYNVQMVEKAVPPGPITLPPGYTIQLWMPDIPLPETGEYTLQGAFYSKDSITVTQTFSGMEQSWPTGVDYQGALSADGTLSLTVTNQSREPYECYPQTQINTMPPTVRYRLLSGPNVIKSGEIELNAPFKTATQYAVPPGGSLTLTAKKPDPQLTNLPAGQYGLLCCLELTANDSDKALPWGMAYGSYFAVPITVPSK